MPYDPCSISPAAICTNADQVKWTHWRALAQRIDDLAVYLNTPGYTPLTTDPDLPFIEPDLPQVTGVLAFSVTPGAASRDCPTVTAVALFTGFDGLPVDFSTQNMTGATAHAFYGTYAAEGKLFFVHEQDACWCKTIFKVVPTGDGNHTLEFVSGGSPQYGCCQSLTVPVIGETLGTWQNIIPAGYACQWGDNNGINISSITEAMQLNGYSNIYCPECVGVTAQNAGGCVYTPNPDFVQYKFEVPINPPPPPAENPALLISAARHISGHLTWPILKTHMEALFDKIEYILQCENNDGLRPECLSQGPETVSAEQGYIRSNPTLWRKDIQYESDGGYDTEDGWHMWGWSCGAWDLKSWLASLHFEYMTLSQGTQNPAASGNIVQPGSGATAGSISQCTGTMLVPWNEQTGSAEMCGLTTNEYKVYCETINRIADLVDTIGKRLYPKDSFDPVEHDGCTTGDEVIYCCRPGTNCIQMPRRECIAKGGTEVSDCPTECCPDDNCSGVPNPICAYPVYDCTFDSYTCSCNCPNDSSCLVEDYTCCCPDASPLDGTPGGCPGNAGPTATPDMACQTYGASCYAASTCDIGNGPPVTYYCLESCFVGCTECIFGVDEGCLECTRPGTDLTISCTPLPTNPGDPPHYTPLSPDNASCGECDRTCCLKHAAFEEDQYGCLEYSYEISEFIEAATLGTFTECIYPNPDIISTTQVASCDTLICGATCQDYLPSSVETCLNQAGFVWDLVSLAPTNPGWYKLVISAPSPP